MMSRDGVFVPPTCPISPSDHIPDLRALSFRLFAHDCTSNGPGTPYRELEVFGSFGKKDKHGEYSYSHRVDTSSLVIPINSALARKARLIIGSNDEHASVEASENRRVAKIGEILCARVANCRGVIKGKCWALGADAVKEAIEKA